MIVPAFYLYLASLAAAGLAVWLVFVSIPATIRSIYAIKVWHIRDEFYDVVACGDADSVASRHLLDAMTTLAELGEYLTIVDTIALWFCSPGSIRPSIMERLVEDRAEIESLPDAERAILNRFRFLWGVAALKCFLLGSPFGWIVGILGTAAVLGSAAASAIIRKLRHGGSFVGYARDQVSKAFNNAAMVFSPPRVAG